MDLSVANFSDVTELVEAKKLSPAEITSIALYALSVALAFLTEDASVREFTREQIEARAAELFDQTASRLRERRDAVLASSEGSV